MKKAYLLTMVSFLLAVLMVACTKGYESQKSVGNMSITLAASGYPLVLGNNALSVKIASPEGKAVTEAKVDVRYYMPAMPGMAPMEYTTSAALKGDAYTFDANFPMEGGWKIDVSMTAPGGTPQTITFNVDAR